MAALERRRFDQAGRERELSLGAMQRLDPNVPVASGTEIWRAGGRAAGAQAVWHGEVSPSLGDGRAVVWVEGGHPFDGALAGACIVDDILREARAAPGLEEERARHASAHAQLCA